MSTAGKAARDTDGGEWLEKQPRGCIMKTDTAGRTGRLAGWIKGKGRRAAADRCVMFGFLKKKEKPVFITAVIAAGGASTRMGGENKLLAEIDGLPVLAHTLRAFQQNPRISEIVISAKADLLVTYAELARDFGITKVSHVVAGGVSRTESVYRGVCAADPQATLVLVHDGARPMVPQAVIDRVIDGLQANNCAAAAVPVKDTIRQVDPETGACVLLDREKIRAMQTPQGADRQLLAAALKNCLDNGIAVTDELAALETLGVKPVLVEGAYENLKITTQEDLVLAEAFLTEGE